MYIEPLIVLLFYIILLCLFQVNEEHHHDFKDEVFMTATFRGPT